MTKNSSSRLRRNISKSNKNTTILSLAGLILFLAAGFFLFPYIIEGIGNFSSFINKGDTKTSDKSQNKQILAPPTLLEVPSATSSARIKVKGVSSLKGTVEIYVNKDLQDEIRVEENEEFETGILRLKEGTNDITTKLSTIDGDSKLSESYTISFLGKDPTLEITFPQDGAKLVKADKRIEIQGKTEKDNSVTINGTKAVVANNGSFSHLVELNEGDNELLIIARNEAGKNTEKKIKVTYSRE